MERSNLIKIIKEEKFLLLNSFVYRLECSDGRIIWTNNEGTKLSSEIENMYQEQYKQ